jgi:hypothetical protein
MILSIIVITRYYYYYYHYYSARLNMNTYTVMFCSEDSIFSQELGSGRGNVETSTSKWFKTPWTTLKSLGVPRVWKGTRLKNGDNDQFLSYEYLYARMMVPPNHGFQY